MPDVAISYQTEEACQKITDFGKSQLNPCPVENVVGACYVYKDIAVRELEVYYASEFTKESAMERCKNGSGSNQEPPFEGRKSHHVTTFMKTYDKNFLPTLE